MNKVNRTLMKSGISIREVVLKSLNYYLRRKINLQEIRVTMQILQYLENRKFGLFLGV